jgi:hypothetical protein
MTMRRKISATADRVLDIVGAIIKLALIICVPFAAVGWVIMHWPRCSPWARSRRRAPSQRACGAPFDFSPVF